MPRNPRFVLPDVVHHVVARGVNRCQIFRNGYDKRKYLNRFALVADEEKVLVHGYCLMSNHVHWLLTPTTPDGLAKLFRRLHTWWAMRFNTLTNRSGHLFQSRFYSSPLEEGHFWAALRYVELNPKSARLTDQPEDWEFSSLREHLGLGRDALVKLETIEGYRQFSVQEWREFLKERDPEKEQDLRRALAGSRPCGSIENLRQLERKYQRKLAWSPPGVRYGRHWLEQPPAPETSAAPHAY